MPGVPPARFAYLGPEGTFTEAALRLVPAAGHGELVACATVVAALDAVRAGDVDAAMVPIENSVEGGVSATLDALSAGEPLMVRREVVVPVTFVLAARTGTGLDDVRTVSTHPHAEAQCRRWLSTQLPAARYVAAMSTAAAAAGLAEPTSEYDAVLCAPIAADRAGALLELLEQFAVRGVNLTRIESRPLGRALGQYSFSIDCEGHIDDDRVAEALMGLHRVSPQVRFLGSYPRADAAPPQVADETTNAAFKDAQAWMQRLRDGKL
jgi:prephenate dehydratase